MKRKVLFALLALILTVSLMAPQPKTVSAAGVQAWKLAHISPPHHHFSKYNYPWLAKNIEKATKGEIKVKIFGAQALGKVPEMYEVIRSRRADLGFILFAITPGVFPKVSLLELPMVWRNSLQAYVVARAMLKEGLLDEALYKEVKVIGLHPEPIQVLASRKPVTSMADLKGLRVRSAGGMTSATIKALGASPATLSTAEQYTALQRGVIDGTIMTHANMYARKATEVCKYVLQLPLYTVVVGTIMNKGVWDSLPKKTKAKLDRVFEEYNWRFINVSQEADDLTISKIYPRENVTVNYLPPAEIKKAEEACKNVWAQWVDAQVK